MNIPTYQSELLQVKAYRILRNHVLDALAKSGLSTTEWAILGIVYERKDGMRLSELAATLDVEAPFVTAVTNDLQKKELIEIIIHPKDRRAKLLFITKKSKSLVPKVEESLKSMLKELLSGTTKEDMDTYRKVLETIVKNSQKVNLKGGEKNA